MSLSRPGWLVLLVLTILLFGLTLGVNYVLSAGLDVLGLNFTSQGDISDKYYLDITPASWTFSIWGVIYVWQAIWMIYAATLLCRKSEKDDHLYCSPAFFSHTIFIAYILNLLCNITWNFFWSLEHIQYALIFIALIPFFLYISIGASFYGLRKYGQEMINLGQKKDVIMTIIFIQNGMGIYAAWVTVATLLNFAMVLHYYIGVDLVDSGSIALGIIGFELLLWVSLDNTLLEKCCRYFYVPHLTLIYALIGSVEENWKSGARNSIITVVLISLGALALVLKIILGIIREKRSPLFDWKGSEKTFQPV